MPVKNVSIWWVSVLLDPLKLTTVFHRLQKEQDQDSKVQCMMLTVQKNHKYSYHQWYFWHISCLISQWRKWQRTVFVVKLVVVVFFSVHQQTLSFPFGELHRQVLQATCLRLPLPNSTAIKISFPCKQPSFSPC